MNSAISKLVFISLLFNSIVPALGSTHNFFSNQDLIEIESMVKKRYKTNLDMGSLPEWCSAELPVTIGPILPVCSIDLRKLAYDDKIAERFAPYLTDKGSFLVTVLADGKGVMVCFFEKRKDKPKYAGGIPSFLLAENILNIVALAKGKEPEIEKIIVVRHRGFSKLLVIYKNGMEDCYNADSEDDVVPNTPKEAQEFYFWQEESYKQARLDYERLQLGKDSVIPGIPLRYFIQELSLKFNIKFTVEHSFQSRHFLHQTFDFKPLDGQTKESIFRFLEKNASIPFIIYPNPQSSDVYHVVESKLLSLENYLLNTLVNDYEYEGTPEGLLLDLQTKGIPISLFTTGLSSLKDNSVPVKVKVSSAILRDVLWQALPLEAFDAILFTAKTDLESPYTGIVFTQTMVHRWSYSHRLFR